MVSVAGFEPAVSWFPTKWINQTFPHTEKLQNTGGSCGIRTHGPFSESPVFKAGAIDHSAKLP